MKVLDRLSAIKHRLINKKYAKLFKRCGNDLIIYGHPRIINGDNMVIGNNVTLNDNCLLAATSSSLIIGNNVTVSPDAKIIASCLNTELFLNKSEKKHILRQTEIGDNVWIASGAIICPGITISGGVIVGAGSVVTKDISESRVIVAGNPAKVVRRF